MSQDNHHDTDNSRGPDGRFASPTPGSPDAAASSVTAPETPASAQRDGDPAPDTSRKDDARAIFARITGTATADDPGTAGARPPAERENQTATGAPSPEAVAKPPADAAAKAADAQPYADYAGSLDRKTGDLLKGARMLLPADEWKALSVHEQMEHIALAKEVRRDQQDAARARQQTKQPPAAVAAPVAPPPAPQGKQANTGQQLDPATRGEPPVSGQQTAIKLPQQVQDKLDKIAAEFGADSAFYLAQRELVESVLGSVQHVQTASQQAFQQQQEAFAQQQREAVRRQQEEQATRQFEDSILSTYVDAAPSLKNVALVDELRQDARRQFLKSQERGDYANLTPEQVADAAARIVRRVVISEVGPEIQQHEAKKRKQRETQSLSGSVQRGQPNTGKPPALTQRERAKQVWDKLHAPA